MISAIGFTAISVGVFFLPLAFLILAALQWSRDHTTAVLLLLASAVIGFIGTGIGEGQWLTYALNETSHRSIFASALALGVLTLLLRREALRRKEETPEVGVFETAVTWAIVVVCIASLAGLPGLGQVAEDLAAL